MEDKVIETGHAHHAILVLGGANEGLFCRERRQPFPIVANGCERAAISPETGAASANKGSGKAIPAACLAAEAMQSGQSTNRCGATATVQLFLCVG